MAVFNEVFVPHYTPGIEIKNDSTARTTIRMKTSD